MDRREGGGTRLRVRGGRRWSRRWVFATRSRTGRNERGADVPGVTAARSGEKFRLEPPLPPEEPEQENNEDEETECEDHERLRVLGPLDAGHVDPEEPRMMLF